jgi:hypothetical protein
MPRTTISVIDVVAQQSVASSFTACAAEMKFLNDGSMVMQVDNTAGGGVLTVTVIAVPDEAGRTGTSTTPTGYSTTVAAGAQKIFGPFRQAWWNQTSVDVGYVYVNFSMGAPGVLGSAKVQIINT